MAKLKKPKRTTKGPVMKEDVLLVLQNYIRQIQMNDYGTDSGITQLYHAISLIEELPLADPVSVQEYQAYVFPQYL